jgi:phytoene/squalene synthetase
MPERAEDKTMDLRTGRMYWSKEEALADGVPESDIAEVLHPEPLKAMRDAIPVVKFSKHPFGSIKNAEPVEK